MAGLGLGQHERMAPLLVETLAVLLLANAIAWFVIPPALVS